MSTYVQEYARKLRTPEEAVKIIKSGIVFLHISGCVNIPCFCFMCPQSVGLVELDSFLIIFALYRVISVIPVCDHPESISSRLKIRNRVFHRVRTALFYICGFRKIPVGIFFE